ncbi:MAG: alpha/beta hydrolase [Actinomycetota bacterium]
MHRYLASPAGSGHTLLLLHGTGANEDDLIPLGRALDPDANILSPRGKVLENGMPRFFRRLAMGVFDEEDLIARTHELAGFVRAAADHYGFDAENVTAVGFSNGANIGASTLFLEPDLLARAILLRAMVPFERDQLPDLAGRGVFIAGGRVDPMIPQDQTEVLVRMLEKAGADVTLRWENAGHELTRDEVDDARVWLTERS